MFTFVRNSNANRRKVALFEESEPRDYAHGRMFERFPILKHSECDRFKEK